MENYFCIKILKFKTTMLRTGVHIECMYSYDIYTNEKYDKVIIYGDWYCREVYFKLKLMMESYTYTKDNIINMKYIYIER